MIPRRLAAWLVDFACGCRNTSTESVTYKRHSVSCRKEKTGTRPVAALLVTRAPEGQQVASAAPRAEHRGNGTKQHNGED